MLIIRAKPLYFFFIYSFVFLFFLCQFNETLTFNMTYVN